MLNFLRTMTNGDIEDICLENILNAKLTQMVASKGVKFKQYAHSKPTSLSYYSVNFLSSGVGKDFAVDCINNYLMPFLKTELERDTNNFKEQYRDEQLATCYGGDKKEQKQVEERINDELVRIGNPHIDIADATFTAIYTEAEQIARTGIGTLSLRMMEFSDYVENASDKDTNKKETLEKLKDIFDGKIQPRLVAGEKRNNYENIPVTGVFASDHHKLLKEKTSEYWLSFLETGFGRRAFIYIPTEFKPINIKNDWEAKENALMMVDEIKQWLYNIYCAIPRNMVYEFSDASKKLLSEYWDSCKVEYNNEYMINPIYANSVNGSHWIITKLAVVLHAIDNPSISMIDSIYAQKAIDFYNRLKPCLKTLINKKGNSPESKLKQWLLRQTEPFKTKDVRDEKFVSAKSFKYWFEDALKEVADEIQRETGIIICEYNGFGGNTKAYQIIRK